MARPRLRDLPTAGAGGSAGTPIVRLVFLMDGICVAWAVLRLPVAGGSAPWSDYLPHLVTLTGLVFALAGTIAARRQPHNLIGLLLVLVGPALYAEDLRDAPGLNAGAYLAVASTPLLLHLTLAYPTGHLRSRTARAVVLTGYAWAALVPAVRVNCLLGRLSYLPASWCALGDRLLEAGNVVVSLTIGAILLQRTITASADTRRLYAPLLAATLVAVIPAVLLTLPLVPAAERVPVRLAYHLSLLGVPVAFLVGVLRIPRGVRLLSSFSEQLRMSNTPADVEAMLRRTLGDHTVRLGVWDADCGNYLHLDGTPMEAHDEEILEITEHGGHQVALSRSQATWVDPRVHASAARLAAVALAHHQAAEDERLRLRRDLHDSAQQLLVAATLKLRMAEDRVRAGETVAAETFNDLREDLEESLAQLRRISHGQPVALGPDLGAALRAIAERTPEVRLALDTPPSLGTGPVQTAYFVVAEAVTNALRHAQATEIAVTVTPWTSETWRVTIVDNGGGTSGQLERPGGGIEGLRQRVERIGGSLDARSTRAGVVIDVLLPRRSPS